MTAAQQYDLREVARALRTHRLRPVRTKADVAEERDWLEGVADRLEQIAVPRQ